MKELVDAIRARGVGVGTEIVKVDMFLNHRLDTDLFVKMGRAFADAFLSREPDLVLTVEASGIAAALTTAMACGNIPVVFLLTGTIGLATAVIFGSLAVAYIWMRIVTSRDDQRLTQMVLKLKLAVRNPNRVLRNGARSYAPIGYRGGRHVWRR